MHVGQLVSAVVGLIGFGFGVGTFQSGLSHSREMTVVQAQLNEANSKDRSGPFGTLPSEPCEILTRGNDLYSQGQLEKAMMVYKTVEFTDRIGKKVCTNSIYATIATVNTLLIAKVTASDSVQQAFLKSETVRYRTAQAAAEKCQSGDCASSVALWK
jgi:hypothetical protein